MGRIASRLKTVFEASLNEFANAMAAQPPASTREALRLLRGVWREIRTRHAQAASAEAVAFVPLLEDEGESKVPHLANAERLALETIAAALQPAAPIDYLSWAEANIVFEDGPDPAKFQFPRQPDSGPSPADLRNESTSGHAT